MANNPRNPRRYDSCQINRRARKMVFHVGHRTIRAKPRLIEMTPGELEAAIEQLSRAGDLVMGVGHVMRQKFGAAWVGKAKRVNNRIAWMQAEIIKTFKEKYPGMDIKQTSGDPETRRTIF